MYNNKISKPGFLLAVSDYAKSKAFYETILEQKVATEIDGVMAEFESGFCIHSDYADLVEGGTAYAPRPTGANVEMKIKPNNWQLAFEVECMDSWIAKIKAVAEIGILHDVAEYNWGQRVFRFCDYDGHIIEIGEDLKIVIKRFLSQGLSVEAVSERFGFPLEYVQQLLHTE